MTLGFRGKKFGARLLAILCISLFVVVVQILTVSRLSIPNRYPWEEDELKTVYHRPEKEEHRRGVRNTLEVRNFVVCFFLIMSHVVKWSTEDGNFYHLSCLCGQAGFQVVLYTLLVYNNKSRFDL